MESLYAIGLGLGLRVLIDAVTRAKPRLDGVLIGLWEGVVLNHFLWKYPTSTDPYVGFIFRLFVDFVVTTDFARLTVVVLWTGLGMVLSDVVPDVYHHKRFRRLTRPFRRWLAHPNLDFTTLPSIGSGSRVRFHSEPRGGHRSASGSVTPTARASTQQSSRQTSHSRRNIPGYYQSETETSVTNRTGASIRSDTTSPAQIIPPFSQPPALRTRQVVSPGPSILSNRSVQITSPTSNIHQVLSPPRSAPSTVISSAPSTVISPPPPTQLPLSPPHISPQSSSEDLEYADNLPPPADLVATESGHIVSSPDTIHVSAISSRQEPFNQQSGPVNHPPLEDIPELSPEEVEQMSPEKYVDELDPLSTPPGLAKGVYASDDIDQLTTPPGLTMPMPIIDRSNDRPPSYHFLPFTSAYDQFPPPTSMPGIPEMTDPIESEDIAVPPSDRKEENPEAFSEKTSSMMGEGGTKFDGAPTRAAASGDVSVKGGHSARADSQADGESVKESVKPRKGGSTKSWSLKESIRESLWGGSAKDEVLETGSVKAHLETSLKTSMSEKGADNNAAHHFETGDPPIAPHLDIRGSYSAEVRSRLGSDTNDSPISAGQAKQTILEDAKRLRKQAEEQEKNRAELLNEKKQAESDRLPHRALSLKLQVEKADKEAHKLHEKATKRIIHANNRESPPHTSNMEGLKVEEAAREAEKAYQKAMDEGATQLNILCGSGKQGLAIKRRLVRLLEDDYKLQLSASADPRKLIVPLPNVPPAFIADNDPKTLDTE